MSRAAVAAAALAALVAGAAGAQTLTGWATLPAATFADGPTSGRFASPNPWGTNLPPYIDRQPVQGFSGVLPGPRAGTFHLLVDNGFGARANSADALLRRYTVAIDWRTKRGGSGTLRPADRDTGEPREAFDARSRITFDDAGRWLTGADFDIESIARDRDGRLWLGDEFGPYLLQTNARGRLLGPPIPLPGVRAPTHPDVLAGRATANLPASGGFEGLTLSTDGARLYAMLEQAVEGDPAGLLRISEFDLEAEAWSGRHWFYPLAPEGMAIGDIAAVDESRFIVIERNSGTATTPLKPFKRLYLVDLGGIDADGTVRKTLLVDLMDLADPHDLDGDGRTRFEFPFITIENLLVLDRRTLLVANDNNFPYGGGREPASDATEVLRIRLDAALR